LDAGAVLSDRHTLIMRHTDLQYTNGFRRPGFLRRHEFLRKCAHVRGHKSQVPAAAILCRACQSAGRRCPSIVPARRILPRWPHQRPEIGGLRCRRRGSRAPRFSPF